jgi:acyl-CoA synthetase (AMP-forming)/AMP-acid ligase II
VSTHTIALVSVKLTKHSPQVAEVTVVGIPSKEWGQQIIAVVVLEKGIEKWSTEDMRSSMTDLMAKFKIPKQLHIVDSIPKNAMGKGRVLHLQLLIVCLME